MINNQHGLTDKTVNKILGVFARFSEIEKAVLYGSRAKGTFKTGSDIDLTLYGDKLSSDLLGDIAEALDGLLLPYMIDLSIFDDLTHVKLREHIERVGVVFYEKPKQGGFMKAGWEVKTLGDVYSFKNGINFDKTQKNGEGILTIDVFNMYCDGLQVNVDNLYRVNKKISEDYILMNGDILIVRSSVKEEGVAWATFFEEVSEPITFCGFIIRGRPIQKINGKYVVYYLRSHAVRKELISKSVKSTITNINQAILSEVKIPLPPLPEQQRIVAKLDALREETQRLETIYQRKLAALDELKKSLLHQAFNGEL